jgi:hypothetical protein
MDLGQQLQHFKVPMQLWELIRSYKPGSGNDFVRLVTDADSG